MKSEYLTQLDEALAAGVRLLSAAFARKRAEFVKSRQAPDGGFAGRTGPSDLYYTDFALRVLDLVEPGSPALHAAADYVRATPHPPGDVVACFNRLNCARLLRKAGIEVPADRRAVRATLLEARREPYHAFLAALCCEILGVKVPHAARAAALVAAMARPGGGFCARPDEPAAQTNATAAAIALLIMTGTLSQELVGQAFLPATRPTGMSARPLESVSVTRQANLAGGAAAFLASMQAPDGGFLAHCAAREPDLLSAFTATATLAALNALDRADLAATARFVQLLADEDGGFRSARSDSESDVEYTYYGVATIALLRRHASAAAR